MFTIQLGNLLIKDLHKDGGRLVRFCVELVTRGVVGNIPSENDISAACAELRRNVIVGSGAVVGAYFDQTRTGPTRRRPCVQGRGRNSTNNKIAQLIIRWLIVFGCVSVVVAVASASKSERSIVNRNVCVVYPTCRLVGMPHRRHHREEEISKICGSHRLIEVVSVCFSFPCLPLIGSVRSGMQRWLTAKRPITTSKSAGLSWAARGDDI